MLKDLNDLKTESIRLIDENMSKELVFTKASRDLIARIYNEHFENYPAKLSDSILRIENKDGQSAYLPFQWFARIHQCRKMILALNEYVPHVNALKEYLKDEQLMRDLPKVDWKLKLDPAQVSKIEQFIEENFSEAEDKVNFEKFLDGRNWLYIKTQPDVLGGRKLNRMTKDYVASSISNITRLINDTAGKLDKFIELYMTSSEIRNLISSLSMSEISEQKEILAKGENIIYYGAPGTGKSHTIDDEIIEGNTIRTVFHADTTNSDFMGCLKPIMNAGAIEYDFRPGPFTNAVCNAIKEPEHHHWLIIEEINRAPAAAVFGEIFQLLDRESGTGASRYSITLSDLDMKSYIEGEIGYSLERGKLKLPGNLTLLATMNSSDQAVMPLDTAFKRRWQFRYIPLDFNVAYKGNGKACAEGELRISDRDGSEIGIDWKSFATIINKILTEQDIPEDRHLGPFFLSESEMKNNPKEALTGKLFMYLWDDVLRHGMKDTVFDSDIRTYGQLTRRYDNNEKIFSDHFYNLLEENNSKPDVPLKAVAEDSPNYN